MSKHPNDAQILAHTMHRFSKDWVGVWRSAPRWVFAHCFIRESRHYDDGRMEYSRVFMSLCGQVAMSLAGDPTSPLRSESDVGPNTFCSICAKQWATENEEGE